MKILWELFITFFKIGAFTFGGGYAMLPLIQQEVCDNKHWIKEEEIVDVIALSQSVPGAIAVNASTFIDYKISGIKGALVATLGTVLPSFLIILSLAGLLLKFAGNEIVEKAFSGIRAMVMALILAAVFKMGKSSIKDYRTLTIAVISFVFLLLFDLHPIVAIIFGGLAGVIIYNKFILLKDKEGCN